MTWTEVDCEGCNKPDPNLSWCRECTRKVCRECMVWPGEVCRSCTGPSSKVDTVPLTHDEAVASLKALGIYEKCMEAFGWTP